MPPERVRPAGGDGQVVGAGEAGDAVQQDDDILAVFHQPLGPLQGQFGHAALLFHRLVEGGGKNVAVNGPPHVGDLLGAFADEDHHQDRLGHIFGDAVGDLLQDGGLAGLGGRDDEAPLAQADGGEEVHHAGGQVDAVGFQHDLPLREYGGQVFELGPVAGVNLVGFLAVDPFDPHQAEVAFTLLGRAHLPGNGVAGPQAEAADLGLGNIHVAGGWQVVNLAEKAVALVHDFQDARG